MEVFLYSPLRVCILLVLILFMVTLIPIIPSQSHEDNTLGVGARLMSVIPGARVGGGLLLFLLCLDSYFSQLEKD